MLDNFQSVLIMLATVGSSAAFLLVLRRLWPSELRRQQNELIGWHVSVLGSTYAVIIGFMLFAVWTNFETAEANAESEANCLVNVVRASRGLSAEEQGRILTLARRYVDVMLTIEWPAMSREEISPVSHPLVRELWATLIRTDTHNSREQTSLDHALTQLARMTDFRRLRQLQVDAYLPGILWVVLILGASVTIMSACLFGASDFRLHLIQVIMLALLISSILVAIADINRPFQGSVHVSPEGFERARQTLSGLS